MGVYNSFGEHEEQLKVGECVCHHYTIGDNVDLVDGIYCGYERAIVISGKRFVADMPLTEVYNKWGGVIPIDIESSNPVKTALDEIEKAHETKENNL